jgi:hypothetical protein
LGIKSKRTWDKLNSNSNPLSRPSQTRSSGACTETSEFAIPPCHSKFTFLEAKTNSNFGEVIKFIQTSLNPPINLAQIQKQFYFQVF